MRSYLQQVVNRVRASHGFVPFLVVIAAILLSQATIKLDRVVSVG